MTFIYYYTFDLIKEVEQLYLMNNKINTLEPIKPLDMLFMLQPFIVILVLLLKKVFSHTHRMSIVFT